MPKIGSGAADSAEGPGCTIRLGSDQPAWRSSQDRGSVSRAERECEGGTVGLRRYCVCGHYIESHGEGPGECEGCANDGEDGYCQQFTLAGHEDDDLE